MKFTELVRLLKKNGFKIVKEKGGIKLIELEYSLTIEATEEPDYFGFYSPGLEGVTEIGHSIEDCIYKAKWGMKEHITLNTTFLYCNKS